MFSTEGGVDGYFKIPTDVYTPLFLSDWHDGGGPFTELNWEITPSCWRNSSSASTLGLSA